MKRKIIQRIKNGTPIDWVEVLDQITVYESDGSRSFIWVQYWPHLINRFDDFIERQIKKQRPDLNPKHWSR